MELQKSHYVGMGFAIAILLVDLFVFGLKSRLVFFVAGIAVLVGVLPFLITVMIETGREREKEMMFIEFTRDLVESVKTGTPISKGILHAKGKDYGSLTPHISKLVNQVALGIPVKQALRTFSKDVNNPVIGRSVTLIGEAEEAGGLIDTILESVAKSVSEIEDIKKEQKAAVYNLVVQGYIIFFIFIIIMLVTEIKIIPMTLNLPGTQGGIDILGVQAGTGGRLTAEQLSLPFLILLIVQGLFAGLVIGKLSEGSIKSGIKHSVILIFLAYLVTTGVRVILVKPPVPT